jgi:predicted PurR-regulated permease PerM
MSNEEVNGTQLSEEEEPQQQVAEEDDSNPPETNEKAAAAVRIVRSLPLLSGLPGWAVMLLGAVLASLALILFLSVVKLGLVVVYEGLGGLLSVLLVSLVLAYLLDPLIDRFEKAGWDRSLAIAISLGLSLSLTVVLLLLTIPYVVTELSDLGENMDGYVEGVAESAASLETWLQQTTGLSVDLRFAGMKRRLPALLARVGAEGLNPLKTVAGALLGSTFGLLGAVVQWSLLPLFTFFFLRDFDAIKAGLFALVPFRWRKDTVEHYLEIDERMSRFVRGQIIVSLVLAALYATGLGVFTNIDLAVLIGVVAGVLFVVPYFGTFLGIVTGSVLAFLKFGVDFEVLKVWAVFGVVQGIEGALLTPKIVGDSVGLHPVLVLLALVAGGNLFGFLGILLAVPVAAALQVLLESGLRWYRGTHWFREGEESAPGVDAIL